MTNQRLISDAKRRARAESRWTGRPYQTILEEIAHQAGRAGWSAFVIDPAEPLPAEDRPADDAKPVFDPDDKQWDLWVIAVERLGQLPMILGIALIAATAFGPNYVRTDTPFAEPLCMAALAVGVTLTIGSLWYPGYKTILLYALSWSAPRPLGLRRATVLALGMFVRVCLALAVPMTFTEFGPLVMTGARADTIFNYQNDVQSHRAIHLEGVKKELPVAAQNRQDDHVDLSLVMVDSRLQPRPMRALRIGDDAASKRFTEALKDAPVIRFLGRLDCRSGRFHSRLMEAAASYDAPAVATKAIPIRTRKGKVVDTYDVRRLCGVGDNA